MNTNFVVHTLDSAPEQSRPALLGLKQAVGLIPNLAATMAGSPPLIEAFVGALGSFGRGSFTAGQRQVLLLTNAVANRCAWAVAFHSTAARREGVEGAEIEAIRAGRLPAESSLAALSRLTRALIDKRGHLDPSDLDAFTAAGFAAEQALEVVAGLACSTMANYAGNFTRPPLDAPFAPQAWSAPV
jgi:AhpD family alkylhydroperoxidase